MILLNQFEYKILNVPKVQDYFHYFVWGGGKLIIVPITILQASGCNKKIIHLEVH